MKTREPKVQTLRFTKVIFDLDNTLIDAEAIKEALFKEVGFVGISRERAKHFYETSKQMSDEKAFRFDTFLQLISQQVPRTQKGLTAEKFETQLRQYVKQLAFPYTKEILGVCKNKKIDMYLLSSGNKEWQMKKMQWTGIANFFSASHIMIVSGNDAAQQKCKMIKKVLGEAFDGSQTLYIDDRPDMIQMALENFLEIVCFLRHEERDTRFPKETFETLKQRFPQQVFVGTDLSTLRSLIV